MHVVQAAEAKHHAPHGLLSQQGGEGECGCLVWCGRGRGWLWDNEPEERECCACDAEGEEHAAPAIVKHEDREQRWCDGESESGGEVQDGGGASALLLGGVLADEVNARGVEG